MSAPSLNPQQQIAVLGEALIDIVETGDDDPRAARPGGSPYNVAIGLARLGRDTAFLGRLSHDPLGIILRNHAQRSDVDLGLAVDAREPSTIALVELHEGIAQYRFGVAGTADFRWTDAELSAVPLDFAALHYGSLAAWTPPGDAVVHRFVTAVHDDGRALISYDPNVRPHLQPDGAAARVGIERSIALAHLVKTSEEDIVWLHPGRQLGDVAREWLALGPDVVVVTRGGDGATAYTRDGEISRPTPPTDMVDTVGAGDAFMSGLIDALAGRDLLAPAGVAGLSLEQLGEILDDAALVASMTCAKAGANPPRRHELDARRSAS